MSLQLVTAAAARALDWASQVQGHLRLDSEAEKARVEAVLIPAAERWCEGFTRRALVTQTWRMFLDHFPGRYHFPGCCADIRSYDNSIRYGLHTSQRFPIEIPKPPLRSITHIKYYDSENVQQTWPANKYEIDPPIATPPVFEEECQPYRVWPVYGESYPVTHPRRNAIEIEFQCGYGPDHATVPAKLAAAMLLIVAEQYEHREDSVTGTIVTDSKLTAERLAWPFRVRLFSEAA